MAQRDLRKVASALRRLEKAERELYETIVAARRSGETLRDIGNWAKLSPQRIHQILKRHQNDE